MTILIEGVKESESGWTKAEDHVYAEIDRYGGPAKCVVCGGALAFSIERAAITAKCCGYMYRAIEKRGER